MERGIAPTILPCRITERLRNSPAVSKCGRATFRVSKTPPPSTPSVSPCAPPPATILWQRSSSDHLVPDPVPARSRWGTDGRTGGSMVGARPLRCCDARARSWWVSMSARRNTWPDWRLFLAQRTRCRWHRCTRYRRRWSGAPASGVHATTWAAPSPPPAGRDMTLP